MAKKTKKTKLEDLASTKIGQIKIFIQMAKYARTSGSFGGFGITYEDLIKKGVSDEIFMWLVQNHYTNKPQKGKALWIANTNKFYPTQTIDNLENFIKMFEEKQTKKENNDEAVAQ